MTTTSYTIRPGDNNPRAHDMSPGDVQNVTFNTGTGTKGGVIDFYAGSSYMQFDYALFESDGVTPVLVNGQPVAGQGVPTPRVLFRPNTDITHPWDPHLAQNTDYVFRLIKTAEASSGPFGVDSHFLPFATANDEHHGGKFPGHRG